MQTLKFRRRRYESFGQFRRELAYLLKHRQQIRQVMRGDVVSAAFRQRLMLVVTSVNRCRYCAAYHSQASLSAGLSPGEISILLDGTVKDCPVTEIPALLYARFWAEQNGQPEETAYRELAGIYGSQKAAMIEITLKTIRWGNLTGNTFDYLLCRLSWGLAGCPELKHKTI